MAENRMRPDDEPIFDGDWRVWLIATVVVLAGAFAVLQWQYDSCMEYMLSQDPPVPFAVAEMFCIQ